ncbi:MAG: hypothetical protein IPL61_23770 [Myxococcales bacterium]|nr:hypothetical protein [Myxococcales bacterium]
MSATVRTLTAADLPVLARFYDELYLPAFAHQREPRAVWDAALLTPAADLRRVILLAGTDLDDATAARLDGGVVAEWYPRCRCGLLTYLVVAPGARGRGLGRGLLDRARATIADHARAAGAEVVAVFGEVADPARGGDPDAAARLARFRRWGARVVEHGYVQPALGPGLARDRHLRLIAFFDGAAPTHLAGAVVAGFLREFYAVTENRDPDADSELGPIVGAVATAVALT